MTSLAFLTTLAAGLTLFTLGFLLGCWRCYMAVKKLVLPHDGKLVTGCHCADCETATVLSEWNDFESEKK